MKAVILAGGFGTRLSEETELRPKPMVEIGGMPIIWHIMKIYSHYGVSEFIICCGYKGYIIKEYFANYFLHSSDVTINLEDNQTTFHKHRSENWKVTLVDTGIESMTGGRLLGVSDYLDSDEDFYMTYGDGVSDIDISKLLKSHKDSGSLATLTAVSPPGRFGALKVKDNKVLEFSEKPSGENSLINGGFFVLNKKVLSYVENSLTVWEQDPLKKLTADNQLNVFHHKGFWQPMDTLREKHLLEKLWDSGSAPWKKWN